MRNLRNSKGFTLIELMIVVVIIGILAAIAIPKFTDVSKGAKQAEAEPVLKQVYSLQESFKQRNDVFATTLPDADPVTPLAVTDLVGWQDPSAKYFTFQIIRADATTFCAQANLTQAGTDAGLSIMNINETRTVAQGAC